MPFDLEAALNDECSEASLLGLSDDLLCSLLLRVPLHDLLSCGLTSRRLQRAANDPQRVWRPLCEQRWGRQTNIALWMRRRSPQHGPSPTAHRSRHRSAENGHISSGAKSAPQTETLADAGTDAMTQRSGPRLSDGSCGTAAADGSGHAGDYRSLYALLHSYNTFIGLWRSLGDGPGNSKCYAFDWAPDCLEGVQLVGSSSRGAVRGGALFRLGPAYPHTSADALDQRTCVVKVAPQRSVPRAPSRAVNAAAAVGAGMPGSRAADDILGKSPPHSFGAEFLLFMATSLAPSSSGRRNSSSRRRAAGRSASGSSLAANAHPQDLNAASRPGDDTPAAPVPLLDGACCEGGVLPSLHHFQRVAVPRMTRQHPLAGLWTEVMPDGPALPHHPRPPFCVLSVSYDFGRSAARAVATIITGYDGWAAGDTLWWVSASPLPQPLPEREVELLLNPPAWLQDRLHERRHQRRQPLASGRSLVDAIAGTLSGMMLAALPSPPSTTISAAAAATTAVAAAAVAGSTQRSPSGACWPGGAAAPGVAPLRVLPPVLPTGVGVVDVVACYQGQARQMAHGRPEWVDVRLWVLADGDMAFILLGEDEGHGLEPEEVAYLARVQDALAL